MNRQEERDEEEGWRKVEEGFQSTTAYIMVVPLEDNGTENILQLTAVFVVLTESNALLMLVFMFVLCANLLWVRLITHG